MNSFYGGQQGINFDIKRVFQNKTELINDLNKRWGSDIGVEEFVVISYGMPNDEATYYVKVYTLKEGDTLTEDSGYFTLHPATSGSTGEVQYFIKNPQNENYIQVELKSGESLPEDAKLYEVRPAVGTVEKGVSYYKKTSSIYNYNKDVDFAEYEATYNSTFWRKVYIDEESLADIRSKYGIETIYMGESLANYGFAYLLIASMTGNTPKLTITHSTTDPGVSLIPEITELDQSNIDNPKYHITLPEAWDFRKEADVVLDADEMPSVDFENAAGAETTTKAFRFHLPQSQVIEVPAAVVVNPNLEDNRQPKVKMYVEPTEKYGDASINKPYIEFTLPKMWEIEKLNDVVLDANQPPAVTFENNADGDTKQITFSLPQSQVISVPDAVIPVPRDTTTPSVKLITTTEKYPAASINNPYIEFTIPKTWDIEKLTDVVLPANEAPYVEMKNNEAGDTKQITFGLPVSQVLSLGTTNFVNPGESLIPQINYNDMDIDNPVLTFTMPKMWNIVKKDDIIESPSTAPSVAMVTSEDNTAKEITFTLPKMWNLKMTSSIVNAGTTPEVSIATDTADEDFKNISMTLPAPYTYAAPQVEVLDANENPAIVVEPLSGDKNEVINLTFKLPQAQVINDTVITVPVDSETAPSVSIDNTTDVNSPQLTFELPQAVKFFYGNLLGGQSQGEYTVIEDDSNSAEIAGLFDKGIAVKDYYIHTGSNAAGFIYQVVEVNKEAPRSIKFQFITTLTKPNPEVVTNVVDPFNGNKATTPFIATGYADGVEKTGWKWTVSLPKAPLFTAGVDAIGIDETATVTRSYVDNTTVDYNFKIPRGVKWFIANSLVNGLPQLPAGGTEPKGGDLCLFSPEDEMAEGRGNVYRFNGTTWETISTNIEGPAGKALNITGSLVIDEASEADAENTIAYVGGRLDAIYPNIKSDELFGVEYKDAGGSSIYYWYYKINGVWYRAVLTGGLSDLLKNEKDTENPTNKTYTVAYINSLEQTIRNDFASVDTELRSAINALTQAFQEQLGEGDDTLAGRIEALAARVAALEKNAKYERIIGNETIDQSIDGSAVDTLEYGVNTLLSRDSNYANIKSNEVINVEFKPLTGEPSYYWYYKNSEGQWERSGQE